MDSPPLGARGMSKYQHIQQEAYEANMQLNELNLVVYTFGNVSAVDRESGVFAIKPSGVAYEELRYEDIVIVDFDNNIIEGTMRPSSDTKTHAYLYKNWPNIGGVAHTRHLLSGLGSSTKRYSNFWNYSC